MSPQTPQKFESIKFSGAKVQLDWREDRPGPKGDSRVVHLESPCLPLSEFSVALQNFRPLVRDLCELADEWADTLKITGVSLNTEEKDGRRGIKVHCTRELAQANTALAFLTPHLREPKSEGETGGVGFYSDEWGKAIAELEAAATRYANGTRQQADLFEGPKAA
jgi:hypothetical protein